MKRLFCLSVVIALILIAPMTVFADVTFQDMCDRTVLLDEPAKRVIALSAADCEIIYAIGAEDVLVGRGEYCDYPDEVLEIPSVQSGYETNLEQIIALEPDVVIMTKMAQTVEQNAALESAGIKVIVSDAQDIEGICTAVKMIGAATGKDENAEKVVNSMRKELDEMASFSGDFTGKSVYFEVSPLEYGLWTAGSGTFMNEIAELLGLKNCFGDVNGWAEISSEQVIERNPDYIVTISMYSGAGLYPDEEIISRAGWQSINAVKNSKVLSLQNNELTRPSPRLVEGAKMLLEFVPE